MWNIAFESASLFHVCFCCFFFFNLKQEAEQHRKKHTTRLGYRKQKEKEKTAVTPHSSASFFRRMMYCVAILWINRIVVTYAYIKST